MTTAENENKVTLLVDLKKYRIRIHKSTLHLLGDPEYIQLLVNPSDMLVAIQSQEKPGNQTCKINWDKLSSSDNSYELYSRLLTLRLCDAFGCMREGRCYRLIGSVLPANKVAYFSIKEMQPLDGD